MELELDFLPLYPPPAALYRLIAICDFLADHLPAGVLAMFSDLT